MGWIGTALKAIMWLVGLIMGNKPSAEERLGQEETKNENAEKALGEVQGAVAAREADRARTDADPGGMLDAGSPAAAPYRAGPD